MVNIVLDFLLTGYFGLGAAGAAVATVVAQAVSFICALVHMLRGGFKVPMLRNDFSPHKTELTAILQVGVPLALQDVLVNVSFLAIAAIINTLGVIASAAVGVVEKLMGFAFLVPGAFSSAVATMAAQNIGAGRDDRARSSMKWGIVFSLICGAIICLLSQLIPDLLVGIFTSDPAVIQSGAEYVRTYSIDCILVSFVFCMNALSQRKGTVDCLFCPFDGGDFCSQNPGDLADEPDDVGKSDPDGHCSPGCLVDFDCHLCSLFCMDVEQGPAHGLNECNKPVFSGMLETGFKTVSR